MDDAVKVPETLLDQANAVRQLLGVPATSASPLQTLLSPQEKGTIQKDLVCTLVVYAELERRTREHLQTTQAQRQKIDALQMIDASILGVAEGDAPQDGEGQARATSPKPLEAYAETERQQWQAVPDRNLAEAKRAAEEGLLRLETLLREIVELRGLVLRGENTPQLTPEQRSYLSGPLPEPVKRAMVSIQVVYAEMERRAQDRLLKFQARRRKIEKMLQTLG